MGHETPIFVVFRRPQKEGVQLSSLEATRGGFNYAPVSIYIYIYIFFFFLLGGGEGEVRGDREEGVGFLLKIPGGAVSQEEGGGAERAGRVSQSAGDLGGGGGRGKIFFFGAEMPAKLCKAPFSVVLEREWPGCPAIWVGTSRDRKKFMQDNFGLIFCPYKFVGATLVALNRRF